MKHHAVVTFVVAAVLGATIWLLSPWVTGRKEPWDADGIYYLGALVVTGLIAGVVSPKPLWAHYFGSVTGQLSYGLLFIELGPLFFVGVGFLLWYCLLFVAAAFAAAWLRAFAGAARRASSLDSLGPSKARRV